MNETQKTYLALAQRIREIGKGEIDDAKHY